MKLVLVTGSAGFIGTNLVDRLLKDGHAVIGVDNFCASANWKAQIFAKNPNYEFFELDIIDGFSQILDSSRLLKQHSKITEIYNLACPASPPRYQRLAMETIAVCTTGLLNCLQLAKEQGAKILQASTSEIYGNPDISPQSEIYHGNVNTLGPRSCYDEGKRISETICYEFQKAHKTDIKLVRIFNTYGPYMDQDDGRVISNFINQALQGEALTIYGEGKQSRSFQYIDDLITGLILFMQKDNLFGPLNIGNPHEFTIHELADLVLAEVPTSSKIVYEPFPQDDPLQRCPDITQATKQLGWEPKIDLKTGLKKTIKYFKQLSINR